MLIIGSAAMKVVCPELLDREPADFDVIASPMEVEAMRAREGVEDWVDVSPKKVTFKASGVQWDVEVALPGSSGEDLINLLGQAGHGDGGYVGPDVLFTLKKSQRFLKNSPFFWKTCSDYHIMKDAGMVVPKPLEPWLKKREKETYTAKRPSLNQDKKDFFSDDQVVYTYDHDSLHRAIALGDQPAYLSFVEEGCEVKCSKEAFEALPHRHRRASFIEEAGVLALERSLVPFPGVMTPEKAWGYAMMKLLTSVSSGWWREYGYENIWSILQEYDEQYVDKFKKGLANGVVKAHSTG